MKNKKFLTMAAVLAAYAATMGVASAALPSSINTDLTVEGETDTFTGNGIFIGVGGGANVVITGTETIQGTMSNVSDEAVVMNVAGANVKADTLEITLTPDGTAVNNRPKGLILRANSEVNVDQLHVTVTQSKRNGNNAASPDSDAAYGVAVGYNFRGGTASDTAKMIVNDANITVNNTSDSVKGHYTNGIARNLGFARITGDFLSGYQLSGIRVFRSDGAKAEFESNGNVNINVSDASADKIADYNVGVYVSGQDSLVTFNGDTTITVSANGTNSAGIKIGKPQDQGTHASVVANGKLVVDTTNINGVSNFTINAVPEEVRGSGAIRLFDNSSKFSITGTNTEEQSEIKASTNAIVFDTVDYENLATINAGLFGVYRELLVRGKDNINNEVSLKNTKLSTTSDRDDLILANARYKVEGVIYDGARLANAVGRLNQNFQTGAFYVLGAKFTLEGEKSEGTAPINGWAIRAKTATGSIAEEAAVSELAATIQDKALLTGLIHKDEKSRLHMNVDTGATWRLAKKGDLPDDAQRSTATSVTVSADGVIDAGTNVTDGANALYFVKVTEDDTNLGTLSNLGGIITTVNGSYGDVFTIEGNYEGNQGKIKMDTKWDSPGNEEGANSESDLIHITGKAVGSTTVIPVSADGTERVIDGSIASIADDLDKNSVPVVRADNEADSEAGAFIGTANTTGAGELQLAHRVRDGKHEWYWTVRAVNPEPPTPEPPTPVPPTPEPPTPGPAIYDKGVPGYVQMPEVDKRMMQQIIRTLHERRGENHRIQTIYETEGREEPFSPVWAKVIKDYSHHDGARLGYSLRTNGVQIGFDRDVQTDEEGTKRFTGGYLAYQHGKVKFNDRFSAENGVLVGNQYTGSGKVDNYSLGFTRTKYRTTGQYVDYVGQISVLRNQYHAVGYDKETQSGWGFAGSVETGRPYVLRESDHSRTVLEPQGQLVYTYLKLRDIHSAHRLVGHGGQSDITARIGARLSYDRYNEEGIVYRTVYGIANIWRSFTGHDEVSIGQDRLRGDYARTIGELGIGAQWKQGDRFYVYGDIRFERNLGGSSYSGYRGNLGIKYTW